MSIFRAKESCPYRGAFGREERKMVNNVMNYYKSRKEDPPYYGYFQAEYENIYSQKMDATNVGFARAVCTGSIACYLALKSLNLEEGSEVILSPVTDSSPLFAIAECRLRPVIADCKPYSYNICTDSIEKLITKSTKCIFLVHAAGEPADIEKVMEIAKKHKLKVVEDISQSPFAEVTNINGKKKYVGTFGDISACSTMYRKTHNTSSSGGIVYTRDEKLYRRVLELSDRGKQTWKKEYDMRDPGSAKLVSLNYNTDEISTALGTLSLRKVDNVIIKRRWVQKRFYEVIKDSKTLILPRFNELNSPFLQPVFVREEYIEQKEWITKYLAKEGVNLAPYYKCYVYNWEITKSIANSIDKKNADLNFRSGFNLYLNERCKERNIMLLDYAIKKMEKEIQ